MMRLYNDWNISKQQIENITVKNLQLIKLLRKLYDWSTTNDESIVIDTDWEIPTIQWSINTLQNFYSYLQTIIPPSVQKILAQPNIVLIDATETSLTLQCNSPDASTITGLKYEWHFLDQVKTTNSNQITINYPTTEDFTIKCRTVFEPYGLKSNFAIYNHIATLPSVVNIVFDTDIVTFSGSYKTLRYHFETSDTETPQVLEIYSPHAEIYVSDISENTFTVRTFSTINTTYDIYFVLYHKNKVIIEKANLPLIGDGNPNSSKMIIGAYYISSSPLRDATVTVIAPPLQDTNYEVEVININTGKKFVPLLQEEFRHIYNLGKEYDYTNIRVRIKDKSNNTILDEKQPTISYVNQYTEIQHTTVTKDEPFFDIVTDNEAIILDIIFDNPYIEIQHIEAIYEIVEYGEFFPIDLPTEFWRGI